MNNLEHTFKKKFGQNFLQNQDILKKIITCANIESDSLVIEVGAGSGALTKYLCQCAKNVLCYEIDNTLEDQLCSNLIEHNNIDIIWGDFLKRNLKEDIGKYSYSNLYFVSNLPYYITTPIINKIINEKVDVNKIVIMIQKEVGDRIAAKTGSKEYGSLTVFLNYYFDIKKEFIVSRNCFYPRPNVDSIVVSLIRKQNKFTLNNEELFFQLVKDSFKFKRKTLKNNLSSYDMQKIEEVLKNYNLNSNVRAEELPLNIFVEIANNL